MTRVKNDLVPEMISGRLNFVNSTGSVKGITDPEKLSDFGLLDDVEISRLRIDQDTVGLHYLVLSFDTPIAWETNSGWVYKVQQRLTNKIEKHKGFLFNFHAE